MSARRGPRVKPTIVTAGDVAYAERLRTAALKQLEDLRARSARLKELEDYMRRANAEDAAQSAPAPDETHDFFWARAWIQDHGGSIAAALKQTHPDTGGNARDFDLTQEARRLLKRARQR